MQNLFETYTKLSNDCVIYKLLIGNKKYVGSTINLKNRMRDHVSYLRHNKHHSRHLQKSFNKYGKENLYLEILFKFDEIPLKEDLLIKEKEFIDSLHPEFNNELDPTTKNNCITTSRKVYQYKLSGEFLQEFDSCNDAQRILGITGVSHAANIKMIAKSAGGYRWSYEKYDLLPYKYENGSSKSKIKKVYVSKDGIIQEFESIADTVRNLFPNCEKFDSTCTCVSAVILGKFKTYKGYTFKDRGEDT